MKRQAKQQERSAAGNEADRREELVRKAVSGNKDALQDLCREVAADVLFSASRILQNRSDAEDAAQEALIHMCTGIRGLQEPKAFNAWLGRIITNETRRIMQKNSRNSSVVSITDYIDVIEESNEEFLPQDFALKEDDRRNVIAIVDTLPERQREAVILHYYNGLSVTETADAMDVKQQVASRYLKLAREKIKDELGKQEKTAMYSVRGLAALPIGQILAGVFSKEAGTAAITQSAWLQQVLSGSHMIVGKSAVAAKVGAATTVAKAAAAVVATASITVGGMYGLTVNDDRYSPPVEQVAVVTAGYDIIFSGGESDAAQTNPEQASPYADTDRGEMTPLNWQIYEKESGSALYSGEGDAVNDVFALMKSLEEYGEYVLSFRMQDANGGTYMLSREFRIK